jgi:exopolyphosphatase/guanosine-5'-triphosphate,3'-diphosphate pyrophosphatase
LLATDRPVTARRDDAGVRIAALDLGSNTFHLLVAHVSPDGSLEKLDGCKRTVRLGSGLLAGGVLEEAAWDRGLHALDMLLERVAAWPGCRVVAVGTSALREAANGAAFADAVQRRHGLSIEVLGGDEEARLAYAGARSGLHGGEGRIATLDIGGGSVELGVGDDPWECLFTATRPLGVLRLKDLFAPAGGPLSPEQVRAIVGTVRAGAASVAQGVKDLGPRRILFTAGTARALFKLERSRRSTSNGRELERDAVVRLGAHLAQLTPRGCRALGVEESRSDTIAVGALVIATLMDLLDTESVTVSDRGLREGVALREWRRAGPLSVSPPPPPRRSEAPRPASVRPAG